jgi:sialic acid synthase
MSFQINSFDNKLQCSIGKKVFIIAEVGSTHCASFETAKQLIFIAKKAGADCVKFQKRDVETLLTKKEKERKYNSVNAMAPTYGEHRKVMEFSKEQFKKLQEYSSKLGIFFTASGWDNISIDFLDKINVPFIKIASADLTNLPLLEHIAKKKRPIFLSTGMADIKDVETAINLVSKYEKRIVLFQCTSSYPAPLTEINLNVLHQYKKKFNVVLGYSGHELGTVVPSIAVGLGAKVIEKHFTLDKNAVGSDHKTALDTEELQRMINEIRITEKVLGSFEKKIQVSEKPCIKKLCKSVVSLVDIKKGDIITMNMLITKSPCVGIPANKINDIIGKKAKNDIYKDVTITYNDLL